MNAAQIVLRALAKFDLSFLNAFVVAMAICFFCPATTCAQPGSPIWTNRYDSLSHYDDGAIAICVSGSGIVYVTGNSSDSSNSLSSSLHSDYATIAYSPTGLPLWTNRYSGPGNGVDYDDFVTGIAADGSGDVYVTGYSIGDGSWEDYATIGYSPVGLPLWTNRYYNVPGNKSDKASAIAVDNYGNVYVTGSSMDTNYGWESATIAYSSAGMRLWITRNGPANSSASALAVGSNGNVYLTGSSTGIGSSLDYATIAYSNAGLPLWTNYYNGPGNSEDVSEAVFVGGNGNVCVTGYSENAFGYADYATIAYSSNGMPLWTNRYDGIGGNNYPRAVAIDGGGNIYVTGESYGLGNSWQYATVAYSNAGLPLWTNRYSGLANGNSDATGIAVDGRGHVYVTGNSDNDYATLAYSSSGVPLWTNLYNGPGSGFDYARAVTVDTYGNVYVTGSSEGTTGCSDYATIKYAGLLTGPSLSPIPLQFRTIGDQIVLSWTNAAFSLQSAPTVVGGYTNVLGALSPYTNEFSGAQRYFRLKTK